MDSCYPHLHSLPQQLPYYLNYYSDFNLHLLQDTCQKRLREIEQNCTFSYLSSILDCSQVSPDKNATRTVPETSCILQSQENIDPFVKPKKRRKTGPEIKRQRTVFSGVQIQALEKAFEKSHYLEPHARKELAQLTELTTSTIQIWFQNRRAKSRRTRQTMFTGNFSREFSSQNDLPNYTSTQLSGSMESSPSLPAKDESFIYYPYSNFMR